MMDNLWKGKGKLHVLTLKVMYDDVKVFCLVQLAFKS
jgi:hypothetical protein